MSKNIIITGASSGIGKALAQHLASLGHNVIATGRNKKALKELQQLSPDNIRVVVADIANPNDRNKISDALADNESGVYLVHNAGIAIPSTLASLTEESWDSHHLTNLKSPIFLTQQLLPHLKQGGRVLHISTGLAHHALAGFTAYGCTKVAFYMLKEFCNSEFDRNDIAFGSAMPGIVDTPIQNQLRSHDRAEFPSVELFKGFKQQDALLSPATVAKFLAWLLIETKADDFIKNDWNIYDTTHHHQWATSGEVKQRP